MDGNRNWPAWGALFLAGLALFVALSGRFGGSLSLDHFAVNVGPQNQTAQAQAVPAPQFGGGAQSKQDQQSTQNPQAVGPDIMPPMVLPAVPAAPDAPQLKVVPPDAPTLKSGPPGWRGGFRTGGPHFPFGGFFGFPFGLVGGLPQALLIGGLLFFAWRRFGSRHSAPAPAPSPGAARRTAETKRLDPTDGNPPSA